MASSLRVPPRFVPTLTNVVDTPGEGVPARSAQWTSPATSASAVTAVDPAQTARLSTADSLRLEEQLLHRVLQRVDLSLERRLGDMVLTAVQQQLDAVLPRLSEQIEDELRSMVKDALAHELSENIGSVPSQAHRRLG